MSANSEINSHDGFDTADHQTTYIYTTGGALDDALARPSKRRKLAKRNGPASVQQELAKTFKFDVLLDGLEKSKSIIVRQELFEKSWAETEERIQSVLDEANEGTLAKVTSFVNEPRQPEATDKLPAGFIVTGPNIASQGLLFKQLSVRLKSETNGPVFTLKSGDASNLKAILKQIIRDVTNQKTGVNDDAEGASLEQDGPKLLSYDLEILHTFIKAHGSRTVVVAFQDSEAFDTSLVAELVALFNSWMDRIPFVLLFGIATSVGLFHERLSRAASRCLYGAQFDVERTSSVVERIFQRAVAGSKAPIRLGTTLLSSLMERQDDHVQSVQSFTAALKYAYMCHFYGNPLSFLTDASRSTQSLRDILQPEHFESIRILPSFKKLVKFLVKNNNPIGALDVLEDDEELLNAIERFLASRNDDIIQLLRVMHVLASSSTEPVSSIELYKAAFQGTITESDFVQHVLDSIQRMAPEGVIAFLQQIQHAIEAGCPEMELLGWSEESSDFLVELSEIQVQVTSLIEESKKTERPVRSSYTIRSRGVRTTIVAQRVQLDYEKATLSKEDEDFTGLIDRLSKILKEFFTCDNPLDLFLHEVWLYDEMFPYLDVFMPRPRHAIECALSAPRDYLTCDCCRPDEGITATQPITASVYQMYLEAGALINISDLWRAFLENQNPDDEEDFDEREALVLFYRSLADLKLLGMVKQSKKKADHLAKVTWNGL